VPIEIRELHIKVSVTTPAGATAPTPASDTDAGDPDRRALVAECVEQVLQVLRDQRER
jgi:Family of unknown function (DUF5908)